MRQVVICKPTTPFSSTYQRLSVCAVQSGAFATRLMLQLRRLKASLASFVFNMKELWSYIAKASYHYTVLATYLLLRFIGSQQRLLASHP